MKNKFYLLISEDGYVLNMRQIAAAQSEDTTTIKFFFADGQEGRLMYLSPIEKDNYLHMIQDVIAARDSALDIGVDIFDYIETTRDGDYNAFKDIRGAIVIMSDGRFEAILPYFNTIQKYKNNIRRHFY